MARLVHHPAIDPGFRLAVQTLHGAGPDALTRLLVDLQRSSPASSASIADAVLALSAFPPSFLGQAARIVAGRDLMRVVPVDADE